MRKVGIVGCGVIAKKLLIARESGKLTLPIVGVTNRSEQNAKDFLSTLKNPPQYFPRQKLIQESDLIVEAASGSIVPELAKPVVDTTVTAVPDPPVPAVSALNDPFKVVVAAPVTVPP